MGFSDYFSRQARKPSGLFGRFFMSRVFDKGNAVLNDRMKELVDPREDDRILEIGFGTGGVVRDLAGDVPLGTVEGMDFSKAMLKAATRRNARYIRDGRVRLVCGDFDTMFCPDDHYSTVCSANTIYFWPRPEAVLEKIHRILQSDGAVVLAFVGSAKMDSMSLSRDVFQSYSPADVETLLKECGFGGVEMCTAGKPDSEMYCAKAYKQAG